MIKKIAFSKLSHNELLTLSSRIIVAVEAASGINTGVIATILALLKKFYNKFLPLINRSHKSGYKDLLKQKDTNRDDAFRALRDVVLGFSRRLNEVYRKSARFLLEIFIRNGWTIYQDGYQDESAELNQLIKELEGKEATDAIVLLQLAEMFNELKTAQLDFEDTFQNKASSKLKKERMAIAEVRPKVIKNLSDLLDRISSDATYAANSSEYAELIITLNNIIAETATILKARLTRDNDEEELPESDLTVDENNTEIETK